MSLVVFYKSESMIWQELCFYYLLYRKLSGLTTASCICCCCPILFCLQASGPGPSWCEGVSDLMRCISYQRVSELKPNCALIRLSLQRRKQSSQICNVILPSTQNVIYIYLILRLTTVSVWCGSGPKLDSWSEDFELNMEVLLACWRELFSTDRLAVVLLTDWL